MECIPSYQISALQSKLGRALVLGSPAAAATTNIGQATSSVLLPPPFIATSTPRQSASVLLPLRQLQMPLLPGAAPTSILSPLSGGQRFGYSNKWLCTRRYHSETPQNTSHSDQRYSSRLQFFGVLTFNVDMRRFDRNMEAIVEYISNYQDYADKQNKKYPMLAIALQEVPEESLVALERAFSKRRYVFFSQPRVKPSRMYDENFLAYKSFYLVLAVKRSGDWKIVDSGYEDIKPIVGIRGGETPVHRGVLWAVVLFRDGLKFLFSTTHFIAGKSKRDKEARCFQIRETVAFFHEKMKRDNKLAACVLAGDLNMDEGRGDELPPEWIDLTRTSGPTFCETDNNLFIKRLDRIVAQSHGKYSPLLTKDVKVDSPKLIAGLYVSSEKSVPEKPPLHFHLPLYAAFEFRSDLFVKTTYLYYLICNESHC